MSEEKDVTNCTGHPAPPQEMVEKWIETWNSNAGLHVQFGGLYEYIAIQAAAWSADQELEACCKWLRNDGLFETRIGHLRAARRQKPPSLKEQALLALEQIDGWGVQSVSHLTIHDDLVTGVDIIRRALEALPDEH